MVGGILVKERSSEEIEDVRKKRLVCVCVGVGGGREFVPIIGEGMDREHDGDGVLLVAF